VHEIDGRIGQNVLKTRVALLDAEGVANADEGVLRAPTDGVHARIGMAMVDRQELRAEAKTDDCSVKDLCHDRLRLVILARCGADHFSAQPNPLDRYGA
jgi:hypothetical protein